MRAPNQGADLYAVLGAEPSATAEAITSAFRARVWELRPDTRVDAATAERFGEVRAAYRTLHDPVLRAAYDRTYDRMYDRTYQRAAEPAPGRGPVLARTAGPACRYVLVTWVVVPGAAVTWAAGPEPPLRAGPVRWERTAR